MFHLQAVQLPATCRAQVLLVYTAGTLSNIVPNPSSFAMLEKNTVSFIIGVADTYSASIVDCVISSSYCPTLKLTGKFQRMTIHEYFDLP